MCKPTHEKRMLAAETFFRSYHGSREIGESVINFDTPVQFMEFEVLSSSMYVSTSNGGFMLGATEPSHFQLQFLCNNVHNVDDLTYVNLGTLDYDENLRIKFKCSQNIWSDKLILSGRFSALSIVVYGLPKDPEIESVQRKDHKTNLPPRPLPNGVPDIMSLANNQDDSNLTNEMLNMHLDSNYY